MFDLNQEITTWRENLAKSGTLPKLDVDELESHLREEIESLKESKLSAEEAFLVATHRLGSPPGIAREFAKINWDSVLRHRLSWMIIGILAYLFAAHSITSGEKALIWLASVRGVRSYGLGVVALVSNVALLGAVLSLSYFLWCYALRSSRFRKWTRQLTTRLILLVAFLAFLVVISAMRAALPVMAVRVSDSMEYARVTQVFAWTRLAWSILLPMILVTVLIKLGASNAREAETG